MIMTEVTPFELPRPDWYDSDGRIYKDALIENFNAIEARLKQLSALGQQVIGQGGEIIDTSDIHLDDVTLEDLPNKILNLRSFLTIMDLFNYPIELSFNGKKVVRCCYWNDEFDYVTLTNKSTGCSDTNKYVYLNYVDKTISSSDNRTTPANSILIGVYADGQIRGVGSFQYSNINVLYYLARMGNERIYKYTESLGGGSSEGVVVNGRTIGDLSGWHERGWVNPTYRDIGRPY